MEIWVVTGPIGAGKSTVSSLLKEHGAQIVDADLLGHEVLKDPLVRDGLVEYFGDCILKEGQIQRSILGPLVFDDDEAMARLNELTHPPLIDLATAHLQEIRDSRQHELAVLEAAVYFLWPPMPHVDRVISVVANDDVRLQRLMKSRNLSENQVRARMASQDSLSSFWENADIVLDNSHDQGSLKLAVGKLITLLDA